MRMKESEMRDDDKRRIWEFVNEKIEGLQREGVLIENIEVKNRADVQVYPPLVEETAVVRGLSGHNTFTLVVSYIDPEQQRRYHEELRNRGLQVRK